MPEIRREIEDSYSIRHCEIMDSLLDLTAHSGAAQEFRRRFEAEMGTINCRELTGADLTTEEGLK